MEEDFYRHPRFEKKGGEKNSRLREANKIGQEHTPDN